MNQTTQHTAVGQGTFQPDTAPATLGNFSAEADLTSQNQISSTEASKERTAMQTVIALPAIIITQAQIEDFLLANYVRRGTRYVHVDRPTSQLSLAAMSQAVRIQLGQAHPGSKIPADLVRKAIETVTDQDGDDLERMLSVWGEAFVCRPGDPRHILPNETGTVDLNTWSEPAYRKLVVEPDPGVFRDFTNKIFPDRSQRRMLLDWLSWSLQNEQDRPRWGIMLYSPEKGTGKSTFAEVPKALFGCENSLTLNGVSKLTQKFSATALTKKFVNCEEVDIAPKSRQVNDLKALFTDDKLALERKGFETEPVDLAGAFLFTSNHMPAFLKGLDRRLYVVQVSHEGHASGPQAAEFATLIEAVRDALKDQRQVAALYRWLMQRPLSPGFNPYSLNTAVHATPIMQRLLGCDDVALQLLEEHLQETGANAVTLDTLQHYARHTLRLTGAVVQAMMLKLDWQQQKAKWGGAGHSRQIWVRPGFVVDDGKLHGPDDGEENLATHLGKVAFH